MVLFFVNTYEYHPTQYLIPIRGYLGGGGLFCVITYEYNPIQYLIPIQGFLDSGGFFCHPI